MKKKILVTGGAGFIGSNFCNINKDQYDVVALDNLFLGNRENLDPDIEFIQGDACSREDLEKAGTEFDIIVHLAGSSSAPMFMESGITEPYLNSVVSFTQVLDYAAATGVQKVLYASTSSLYANNPIPLVESQHVTPQNHYAVTKFLYEHCASCFAKTNPNLDIIGFRFMSVYGPNEEAKGKYANIVSQFIWDIARGTAPVIYGDGEQFRDFTHVTDVVQALILAIESEKKFGAEVFNIGTSNSASLNQIVAAIVQAMQSDIAPIYIENPVKEVYVQGQCADIGKITAGLGYAPKVELADGIRQQVESLRMERIRETSSDALR